MMIDDTDGQMIFGGLKFPDICLTGEEKPRKNLTQETFPDRGSNPGPAAWQARMLPPSPQRWTVEFGILSEPFSSRHLFYRICQRDNLMSKSRTSSSYQKVFTTYFHYLAYKFCRPAYFPKKLKIIYIYMYISSECSAQRQILHCKRRNLGRSSAKGRSSAPNSATKAAVLLEI